MLHSTVSTTFCNAVSLISATMWNADVHPPKHGLHHLISRVSSRSVHANVFQEHVAEPGMICALRLLCITAGALDLISLTHLTSGHPIACDICSDAEANKLCPEKTMQNQSVTVQSPGKVHSTACG